MTRNPKSHFQKFALPLLAGTLLTGAALTVHTTLHAAPQAPNTPASRTPVVVELFTSEGCSSCPPADAVLSRLEKQPIPGVSVIALGEHVDYWNHGGWADPYSKREFSTRQSDYSNAFRKDSVYTPQMIVDGRTEFVGSDSDRAREAITQAARQTKAAVAVARTGDSALSVRVDNLPASVKSDPAVVVLAITEDGLSSSVRGGENSGRHLSHSAVVRRLIPLGTTSGGTFTATPTVVLDKTWRRGSLHAVVFVQQQGSRRIVGAAETGLR